VPWLKSHIPYARVYTGCVDALASLLDSPRARDAFLLRSIMDPPWSVRIQDRAPLSLVVMVRGGSWLVPDDGEPQALAPGDATVLRGPNPYTFADDPATGPQVVIHPGQRCTAPDGRDLSEQMSLGVRTWGTSLTGSVVMLIGTYQLHGEVSRRLLDVLPPRLVLPARAWDSPLVPVLASEIVKDQPGQEVVLDRLLDLLLIAVLRAWLSRAEADAPGWYRAHQDPIVGRALQLIHNDPAYPWTVATLAGKVGASRAALARRFTDQVGEPPMTYLTGWRLTLAADLLREPDSTVGAVARRVGYGTAFALSAAFKRVRGVSPQEHRALVSR
jgi:AraC-like DNA-binding protein